MTIQALIEHRLSGLNGTGDDKLFEEICTLCFKQMIENHRKTVFRHSGNPYGGDGGVDAFSLNENYSHFRLAFSTNTKWESKLQSEAGKKSAENYNGLFFFSNQEINQKKCEELIRKLRSKYGYPIRVLAKSQIVELIEDLPDCRSLLGIPAELNKLEIQHLAQNNQFGKKKETLCHYVPRSIIRIENDNPSSISSPSVVLSEYVMNPPPVTIMLSPAGYGKTIYRADGTRNF